MRLTAPIVPSFGSSSPCQPSYLYGLLPQTGVSVCACLQPCVYIHTYSCVSLANSMDSHTCVCEGVFVRGSLWCVCPCPLRNEGGR